MQAKHCRQITLKYQGEKLSTQNSIISGSIFQKQRYLSVIQKLTGFWLGRLGQREATVEIKVKRKGGIRFFPQPFFLLMFFNYTYSEVPSKSAQSFFLSLAISSHNSSNTSSSSLLCPFISRANSNLTLVVNSGFINFSMSLLDLLATLKVSL